MEGKEWGVQIFFALIIYHVISWSKRLKYSQDFLHQTDRVLFSIFIINNVVFSKTVEKVHFNLYLILFSLLKKWSFKYKTQQSHEDLCWYIIATLMKVISKVKVEIYLDFEIFYLAQLKNTGAKEISFFKSFISRTKYSMVFLQYYVFPWLYHFYFIIFST